MKLIFQFISVFNPDAIKDIKIMKGGFPAKYGGRILFVVDITMKEGNKTKSAEMPVPDL